MTRTKYKDANGKILFNSYLVRINNNSSDLVSNIEQNSPRNDFLLTNSQVEKLQFSTMGIQSQNRGGAILACKKRATKRKSWRPISHSQRLIQGGVGFVSRFDCRQCVKLQQWKENKDKFSEPKKPHGRQCERNRKTRGRSEQSVFVERTAKANLAKNSAPIARLQPKNSMTWCHNFLSQNLLLLNQAH